jgi:hypothetical protein
MPKVTSTKCVSISTALLPKALKRAQETDRGNFSAYIERLVTRDVNAVPSKRKGRTE